MGFLLFGGNCFECLERVLHIAELAVHGYKGSDGGSGGGSNKAGAGLGRDLAP